MKLLVTHRFRLYPNKRQERQMEDTLETCRRLYNSLLADRKEKGTGFYEQEKSLVTLKSEEKFLRAANAQVLQDVVLRLDKAFQAFFAGLSRHPRFKREGRYNSFTNTKQEAPHFRAGRNAAALSIALFGQQIRVRRWLDNINGAGTQSISPTTIWYGFRRGRNLSW